MHLRLPPSYSLYLFFDHSASLAGAFIDRTVETKGLDYIDTQKAKHHGTHRLSSFVRSLHADMLSLSSRAQHRCLRRYRRQLVKGLRHLYITVVSLYQDVKNGVKYWCNTSSHGTSARLKHCL